MERLPHALIMKGGGIKGLAYVGALRELQKYFDFDWYVGTSAGAITAVFLGAGYSVDGLETLLGETDFKRLLDPNPFLAVFNLFFHQGLFRARTLTKWLDDKLAEKLKSPFRVTLKDLPHRVTVYACRRDDDPLRFDKDDPATCGKAAAFVARCSMSIPFFFTPQKEEGLNVLDGGMRYNYPVRATLGKEPVPFIGLYLGPRVYEGQIKSSLFRDVLNIWTEAADVAALREYRAETIIIDPRPISTLDFGLSGIEKNFLVKAGRAAALEFLAPTHAELSAVSDQAQAEAEEARQQVIAFRRAKRKRALTIFALRLVSAGAVCGIWQSIPGQMPTLGTPVKVTRSDLPQSLEPLVTRIEAISGQPAPSRGTVIYEVDWSSPRVHAASRFAINVDAKDYYVNGFITGGADNDVGYAKNIRDCNGEAHRISCVVPTSYKKAYLFLALRSPDNSFDTDLPFLTFTAAR